MKHFDIVVIGGGPAGLAAATKASASGKKVLVLEREAKLGGILKQCIHDGFGVVRFKCRLSGPEYAAREIDALSKTTAQVSLLTFVTKIVKVGLSFEITFVNREGLSTISTDKIILSTGCRERTAKQIAIHGTNPTGVMSAGQAQYYINIMGKLPTKKCVILGSGDIGLIMARRLTLEGCKVEGVYEVKPTPSGLTRNVVQCLDDFEIPLHLSHTVTRVFGIDRLTAVEVAQVDDKMQVVAGTEQIIECDSLILSVGLIPENEVALSIGVKLNNSTKGPIADQTFETTVDNVFVCGNALHVNDLADYVSESGEIAAKYASINMSRGKKVEVNKDKNMLYVVPQLVDVDKQLDECVFFFRAAADFNDKSLVVTVNGKEFYKKKYQHLRPPEMERLVLDLSKIDGKIDSVSFAIVD